MIKDKILTPFVGQDEKETPEEETPEEKTEEKPSEE